MSETTNISPFIPMKNPYTFGIPVRGEGRFFGREEEQRLILETLENVPLGQKQDMIILGPRRIGKTSLLLWLVNSLTAHDKFVPIFVDISAIAPRNIQMLFRKILWEIHKGYEKKHLSNQLPNFETLTPNIPPDMLFTTFGDDLTTLNKIIANQQLPRLVIIFDETEALIQFAEKTIFTWLRNQIQILYNVIFIVAGSNKLYDLTSNDYASPFYNIFKSIIIKPLTLEAATNLIQQPAKHIGMIIDEIETKKILDITGNSPYFVQGICHHLVERLNQQQRYITKIDDINQIIEFSKMDFWIYFERIWNNTSQAQQVLLYYLAHSNSPQSRQQLVQQFTELKQQSQQEQQKHFDDLVEMQIIQTNNGYYWFVVPLFITWILEQKDEQKIKQLKEVFERDYNMKPVISPIQNSEQKSIPTKLLRELQERLLQTGVFDTDSNQKSIFVDSRIHIWQNNLPLANSQTLRISNLIHYLSNKYNSQGKNALVLFLQVLCDHFKPEDTLYQELMQLANKLDTVLKIYNSPNQIAELEKTELDKELNLKIARNTLVEFTDTELDYFTKKYFPSVFNKFSDNMSKDRKILLLLTNIKQQDEYNELIHALHKEHPNLFTGISA